MYKRQEDRNSDFDFGESKHDIYALSAATEIIEYSNNEVHMAANAYGKGRGVYISGLPYSYENTRLLMRAMFYAASKEDRYHIWYADNLNCEVNAYPESGKYAILNNSNETQTTKFYDGEGNCETITLEPCEILWR